MNYYIIENIPIKKMAITLNLKKYDD